MSELIPKVTVLMPVYNGQKSLRQAIDSILNQTYKNFEFLIINDGSSDESELIIRSYSDKRIRLINNERNIKLISTLNKGLELARGEYIVRMDCDDISLPHRIQTQVDFMDNNPEVGVCGSWIKLFGKGKPRVIKHYSSKDDIKCSFLFLGSLAHPSVIIRKSMFAKYGLQYSGEYIHVEDFELWSRCCFLFPMANIPEVLLLYRINPEGISQKHTLEQAKATKRVIQKSLTESGISITPTDIALHEIVVFSNRLTESQKEYLESVGKWLYSLVKDNDKIQKYNPVSLRKVVIDYWLLFCTVNIQFGHYSWTKFWNVSILLDYDITITMKLAILRTFIKRYVKYLITKLK